MKIQKGQLAVNPWRMYIGGCVDSFTNAALLGVFVYLELYSWYLTASI